MEKYLNKDFLNKLRDQLLNSSLYKLQTGKEPNGFYQNINDIVIVTHIFLSDYVGFEGLFNSNTIIRHWYYYRQQNNIMLTEYPINEKILGFKIEIKEYEEEIYDFLKPFFKQINDNNKLLVVSTVELTTTQLNNYISLVKQIQKSKFNKTIDELNVNEELYTEMIISDIIPQLNEYDIRYANIGKIQNKFTITAYNNDMIKKEYKPIDLGEDKITLIKAFII
jgi:hypothetical protein